jgi:aspartate/tyrosine/aromatic aminotransferase
LTGFGVLSFFKTNPDDIANISKKAFKNHKRIIFKEAYFSFLKFYYLDKAQRRFYFNELCARKYLLEQRDIYVNFSIEKYYSLIYRNWESRMKG